MTFICFWLRLLVTDDVLNKIAYCTNAFAVTKITQRNEVFQAARLRAWFPTNLAEIKIFFGLVLYIGIVKLPKISDYWKKMKCSVNTTDRLHRVRDLVETMNKNFKDTYTPGEDLCIDESVVPFRGRLIFRQYNKQKRHKYGIKLFKLLFYSGKQNDNVNTTPFNVVMSLCNVLLNKEHTMFTDNWYTTVGLARELLKNETHLVGTLRKNRKHFPKTVVSTKLKKGQYIARESVDGITVMKWKDKRDVLVLSTKHSMRFRTTVKHRKQVSKPQIVLDYNKAKGAVDLSDQMTAYQTPLRKTIKRYKKLAIDLLLNTAMVNSLILYQSVTKKKISVLDGDPAPNTRPKRVKHQLKKKEGPSNKSRRACQQCYKNNVSDYGRLVAKNKTKKVNTFCINCPNQPYLCVECFRKLMKSVFM
ncbi:hypothetical protein ABMA27_003397 [Loxostege sticticalis]|uniref:PiggyBac transposable element-derived protein domain-containing protein n=1 Tax=Loxostege sticticalis TaxID=481309 RepID=A0ABR3HSZ3_LOXSC